MIQYQIFFESPKYKEIFRLKDMLDKENIYYGFEYTCSVPRYHLIVFDNSTTVVIVIEGDCTYGGEEDKLEIMGLLTEEESQRDDVVGWLSAEDVFIRIKNYFKERGV